MATVSNTLYPPIVQTYMPAFPYNETARVYFSISSFNDARQIKYIHVSLTDQRTNENVFSLISSDETKNQPISIGIYKGWNQGDTEDSDLSLEDDCLFYDSDTGLFYIDIAPWQLKTATCSSDSKIISGFFETNQYYKVQIRFDTGGGLDSSDDKDNIVWIFDQSNTNWSDDSTLSTVLQNRVDDPSYNETYIKNLNTYLADNTAYFSEWSSICLIKPILIPTITLKENFGEDGQTSYAQLVDAAPSFTLGDMWVVGNVEFNTAEDDSKQAERQETESLDRYTLHIMRQSDGEILYSTDTCYPATKDADNAINEINTLISLQDCGIEDESLTYILWIEAITTNGYTIKERYFPFTIAEWIDGPSIYPYILEDNENGRIKLCARVIATQEQVNNYSSAEDYATATYNDTQGYIIIRRTSDLSNFKKHDLVKIIKLRDCMWKKDDTNGTLYHLYYTGDKNSTADEYTEYIDNNDEGIWIVDRTLGSMNWYEYTFQVVNRKGGMSSPVSTGYYHSEFEHPIFVRDKTQLGIKYDFSISSYKPVVSRVKIDTLGGKYPKFVENAVLGYKQFSISGKISSQEDEYQLFIKKQGWLEENEDAYNYENYEYSFTEESYNDYYKLSQSEDLAHVSYEDALGDNNPPYEGSLYEYPDYPTSNYADCYFHHDSWLEYHDWLWERKFREAAIKWLNDGEPKLMKTLTEGNVCVMLTDISLTPEKTLGRRLYNFTATAYEVGDGYDLNTLDSLGIFPVIDETTVDYEELMGTVVIEEDEGIAADHIGQQTNFCLTKQTWWWDDVTMDEDDVRFIKFLYDFESAKRDNCMSSIQTGSLYLTDVKVRFRNLPHLYSRDGQDFTLVNTKELSSSTDLSSLVNFIGYRMEVKLRDTDDWITIMVNREGYYQFQSDLEIADIRFPEMIGTDTYTNCDFIDISYYVHMTEGADLSRIYSKSTNVKTVVAQERNTFSATDVVQTNIYNKHYYKSNSSTPAFLQYLRYWKGISIDAEPHSILYIRYYDTENMIANSWSWTGSYSTDLSDANEWNFFEIGETGYFNLFDHDSNIYDLRFVGKKMYRVFDNANETNFQGGYSDDTTREAAWKDNLIGSDSTHYDSKAFLRGHEYHKEHYIFDTYEDMVKQENPIHQHVYSAKDANDNVVSYIYYNKKWYLFLDGENTLSTITGDSSNYISWNDSEIKEGTVDEDNKSIYYANYWFTIEDLSKLATLVNQSDMGIAMVPTDATINYTGTLVRYYQ